VEGIGCRKSVGGKFPVSREQEVSVREGEKLGEFHAGFKKKSQAWKKKKSTQGPGGFEKRSGMGESYPR